MNIDLIRKLHRQQESCSMQDLVQMLVDCDSNNGTFEEIMDALESSIRGGTLQPKRHVCKYGEPFANQEYFFPLEYFLNWARSKKYVIPEALNEMYFMNKPDYEYWLSMSSWSVEEATLLICGYKHVDVDISRLIRGYHGQFPIIIKKVYEILTRAQSDGELTRYNGKDTYNLRYSIDAFLKFWQAKLAKLVKLPQELLKKLEEIQRQEIQQREQVEKTQQDDAQKRPHGNEERFAKKREEVLGAALAIFWNNQGECKDAAKLARMVDEKAQLFWTDTRQPPLSQNEIAKLINKYKQKIDK